MRCLLLAVLLIGSNAGCSAGPKNPEPEPVQSIVPNTFPFYGLKKVVDADAGVACYWITSQSLSCVKL